MSNFKVEKHEAHVELTWTISAIDATDVEVAIAEVGDQNAILIFTKVESISEDAANKLTQEMSDKLDANRSFKLAEVNEQLQAVFKNIELVPTLTEAQDLLFMEEVERDLLTD